MEPQDPYGTTIICSHAEDGDNVLQVRSIRGFALTQQIRVESKSHLEYNTIMSFGRFCPISRCETIVLETPLQFTYQQGSKVIGLDSWPIKHKACHRYHLNDKMMVKGIRKGRPIKKNIVSSSEGEYSKRKYVFSD